MIGVINYFVYLRITDDGPLAEMRIWSTLLIKFDLKWCIHLSRRLFLYFSSFVFYIFVTLVPFAVWSW